MNNLLTFDRIRVECPYPLQDILKLEITSQLNAHSRIYLKGVLQEEHLDKCVGTSTANDTIRVYDTDASGSDILLFSGVVTVLNVRHEFGVYYVEIEGMSYTYLMDTERKSRSFQDKNATYSEVIDQIISDYKDASFIQMPKDRAIGSLIVQYNETDWDFVKRLASHFNTVLVPQTLGSGPRFWVGMRQSEKKKIERISDYSTRNDAQAYRVALSRGLDVRESDYIKYDIESETRLMPGDRVEFQGQTCVIERSASSFADGLFGYKYALCPESGSVQPKQQNEQLRGMSLLGSVIDARDATVKIHLRIDKKQDKQKACWIPYAAQSNNVFYCMPEKGENISLYFQTPDETSGIAVNAVRRNGGNCSNTSKPNIKYMAIPTGQEFKLGETDINFKEDDALYITMDADKGVTIQSHDDLSVLSQGKMSFEAQEAIKVLANMGNLIAGSGENASLSQLYMMGGIGGDTHIFASNKLLQDGRARQRFPDQLNKAIAYEVKPEEKPAEKFSWGKLALCVLAAVAVVALVVVTAGAAAVALGAAAATVSAVMAGAAISGGIAIASMAIGDIMSGKNSSIDDYVNGAFRAAVEGAVCGAMEAVMAPLQGMQFLSKLGPNAKLFAKACINGLTGMVTDAVLQLPATIKGEKYDWDRGLTSFATAFGMTYAAAGLNALIKKVTGSPDSGLCLLSRDPVNVVTGAVVSDVTDFELPGLIPLVWHRIWYSDSSLMSHLGHGARCNFEMGLDVFEDRQIGVYLADGRVAVFPQLLPGEDYFNYKDALLLRRETDHYCLFDPQTRYSYLLYPSENGYMQYKLSAICNAQGHKISVEYDKSGYLSRITDSVGRKLDVKTNDAGRIIQVAMGNQVLVQYRYNEDQDLTEVVDAAGLSLHMTYRDHLLMRKTDRNKNSFNWKYDGTTTTARVTETWGNGNVLYGKFAYHDDEGYNELTDSLGNSIKYHYDERNLCTKTVYADYSETRREYSERYELLQEIDEEGRLTSYTYDRGSRRTGITRPDGSKAALAYDEAGRLISTTNPEGASRRWTYNDDDTVIVSIDETGAETVYTYNESKLVEAVTNALGDTIRLAYDSSKNLSQATLPDGTSSAWEYDSRGNCISATNPLGAVQRYRYDELNRLIRGNLADGNEIQLQYNGYDDIVHAKDKKTEVSFAYTALGSLKSRTQADRRVEFEYDTEERLKSVKNERGEVYQFERDLKGNVVKETGFDLVARTYERDMSGFVNVINRPDARWTKYQRDPLGNVMRADYYDGTWDAFEYNKNGELSKAANEHAALKFERNPAGQIIKEFQDEHWVAGEYDEVGRRTRISSSLGANILTSRDAMGQVTHIAAAQTGQPAWAARMQYNELGQEIERLLPGDVIGKWQYDTMGRPTSHQVSSGQRDTLRRSYEWDVNRRLRALTDELTHGRTAYDYDEFSNLVSSQNNGDWKFLYRSSDEAGNIYETQDKSDRVYGAGSRLEQSHVNTNELKNVFQGGQGKLVTKGTEFTYDAEGNLTQKTEPNGDTWEYEYFGNGMLSKVVRPDGNEITFKYDSLGRRIEKETSTATRRFVWDGNTPLHEIGECDTITWLFDDGFVPVAKLTDTGNYSIVSDHLGTPTEAFDTDGVCVWSAELDIYGRVTELTGDVDFVPFRYQGQYADTETGLYYNRFRYYDPITGQYTQQDPIGLDSGNPTLYAYVSNVLTIVDVFGLYPTEKWARDYLRELLGENVHDGGVYFFQTADDTWYIGKADDLYRRLRDHLGNKKLKTEFLESLGVDINPNGSTIDNFKLEADLMDSFRKKTDLANKINSPGKKYQENSLEINKHEKTC